MNEKILTGIKFVFALLLLIAGVVLNLFEIGREFLGFATVGSWLIYVGLVMLAITSIRFFSDKNRKVDERALFIAQKASRVTFLLLIVGAFIVMVADGINKIALEYSTFMSYLICFVVVVYFVSYKIFERMY